MYGLFASSSDSGSGAAVVIVVLLFAVWILMIAAMWKIFTKAGEAGWKSIIPIYNTYVLLKIIGRPAWWLVFLLLPIVLWIAIPLGLAKSFGKSTGFGVGMMFLPFIFMLILGFGDDRYLGPAAAGPVGMGSPPPPPPAY